MIRYLDKFGYVEPNENYLYYVIGDLASHLCRKQSIEKAKKQHPSIIVFPNEFTDFIESHDSYKDLKSRFTNSFDKSNNLTSIDNIIGLFGEIRLIKWLWIHKIWFSIIKTSSISTPDFKVYDKTIELYTPILNQDIFEATTKLNKVNNPYGSVMTVDYNFKALILKVVSRINKKLKKQLPDSQNSILVCNLDFRLFYKHDITPESIRKNLENLFDQIIAPNNSKLDKQEVVQITWHCWMKKGTETLFPKPLSDRDSAIMQLLKEYYKHTANAKTNTLYMYFNDIKLVIIDLKLQKKIGERTLIFTDGYDDNSILITKTEINTINLLDYLITSTQ